MEEFTCREDSTTFNYIAKFVYKGSVWRANATDEEQGLQVENNSDDYAEQDFKL